MSRLKVLPLAHENIPYLKGAPNHNTVKDPDGANMILQSDRFYKYVIVGKTYWMKGYDSITEIRKQFGFGWINHPGLMFIGIAK